MSKEGKTRENLHPTMDGDRDGATLEHWTEPPKVQMRSRRRENMKKEIRTARGAFTH